MILRAESDDRDSEVVAERLVDSECEPLADGNREVVDRDFVALTGKVRESTADRDREVVERACEVSVDGNCDVLLIGGNCEVVGCRDSEAAVDSDCAMSREIVSIVLGLASANDRVVMVVAFGNGGIRKPTVLREVLLMVLGGDCESTISRVPVATISANLSSMVILDASSVSS